MALGILAGSTTLIGFIVATIVMNVNANNGTPEPSPISIYAVIAFMTAIFLPLLFLGQIFVIPFGQALFMSSSFGTLGQRYQRALRPWALAQVGIYAIYSLFFLIATGVVLAFILPLIQTYGNDSTIVATSLSGALGIVFLLVIPTEVYLIAMQVQSGSVGTGMGR